MAATVPPTSSGWFDDQPVLARMTQEEIERKLVEVGEIVALPGLDGVEPGAERLEALDRVQRWWNQAWLGAEHVYGYIAPLTEQTEKEARLAVEPASALKADQGLKGARVKITLERLHVADYPGRGQHTILFDFYAENQTDKAVEPLHHNALFKAADGETAAVQGLPLFVGLRVGANGVALKCYTVNVKSSADQKLLDFLESQEFKSGLHLLNMAQPALAPLSAMAHGLTKNLASRSRNVAVQEFHLGLDFGNSGTHARLRLGSFVAVQVPKDRLKGWKWEAYKYDRGNGHIVSADGTPLDLNYVMFGVSPFEEEKKPAAGG